MDDHNLTIRILIVGDAPQIMTQIMDAFTSEPFQVCTEPTADAALKILDSFQPQLIIVGFVAEDRFAHDFLLTIQSNPAYRSHHHIPTLFFSDTTLRDQYGAELFALGLTGWYTLPLGIHEINEIVHNVLIQHKTIQYQADLVQEVKRSEYRYRDLLENASDLILTFDETTRLTYLNNRFSTLTGFEKSDWVDQPFTNLIQENHRSNVRSQLEKVQHGRSRNFEAEIRSIYPDSPTLSFSLTPIFKRGAIQGAMGIGRDVTEQKRLEKDIHDLENFNESIIQSMESGLLTLDLKGRITSLNQAGEKILGWTAREIIGKVLNSVFTQEEAEILLSDSAQVAPLTLSQETRLTVNSGRQIYIGFNKSDWIDTDGEKFGTLISFREITQLKQMQNEVLRMDRLASLGVLASGIAHEIKNPLAGIKMMAQACEEEMETSDPRKEYLIRIVRQVNRLDDLLKTFFTFAKPRKPDRIPHALHDILREVSQLIQKNLSYQEIELALDIPETLPKILVDSQQMQQVFLNLILNAVDAMPKGGRLTIRAIQNSEREHEKFALFPLQHDSNFLWISVKDTGDGIPDDKLQHIFDPFFTTKPDGMGLGLSIVYRIIQENQGEIQVTSRTGEGTTFHIWLPTGDQS